MPELPEVETTRRGIRSHLEGHRIVRLEVREKRLRWPVPDALPIRLTGNEISAVDRRGKYLLLHTATGSAIIHLGMSGSLRLTEPQTPKMKHDHIQADLESGLCLRFNDPRRFGAWLWTDDWTKHPLLRNLGPEPLGEDFTAAHLFRLSRGRRAPVKAFIMDATTVVGVGNIYATEALFIAGIHPGRAAGRISMARYEALTNAIRSVLAEAIQMGGTTLRDFVNTEGKPGYFKQSLRAYGRGGLACLVCAGPLRSIRLGQRATVYCTRCQR